METIITKRPCLEQSDNDDNDEVDPVPLITHAEAKLQILGLQCYFTEQGSDHAAHSLLDKCADLVHLRGATAIKQTTLLNYIHVCICIMCNIVHCKQFAYKSDILAIWINGPLLFGTGCGPIIRSALY